MKNIDSNNESTLEVYKSNKAVSNRLTKIKTPLQFLIYSLLVAKIDNSIKIAEVKKENLLFSISKREILENLKLVKLQSTFKTQVAELSKLQIKHYYKDKDSFIAINIFSYIGYKDNILIGKINIDSIFYFIDLGDGNFFKYLFKDLVKFASKYTMLLFELLKSDYYKLNREYHFDYDYSYLLQQLQVEKKSMQQFFNFRIKILEKSLLEINAKTTMKIRYRKLLNGKTVEKIRFLKPLKEDIQNIPNKEDKITISEKELEKLRNYKKLHSKKYTIYDNEYYQELEERRDNKIIWKEEDIPF